MQQLNVRRLVCAHPSGKLAGIINQNQILKVLDPAEMYHVMQQMQEVIDLQTSELQELNQRLQDANTELAHLSMVDELTQIVNRRQLNQFLADKWQQLGSSSKSLSLIMCDVDFFKAYNDLYGHLNGDRCLVKIAQALQEVTRKAWIWGSLWWGRICKLCYQYRWLWCEVRFGENLKLHPRSRNSS